MQFKYMLAVINLSYSRQHTFPDPVSRPSSTHVSKESKSAVEKVDCYSVFSCNCHPDNTLLVRQAMLLVPSHS